MAKAPGFFDKRRATPVSVDGNKKFYLKHDNNNVTEHIRKQQVVLFCDTARDALASAMRRESFFLTGMAGTGKSVVLRQIAYALSKDTTVAITSTTGLSAQNIGGETIHKWCGIQRKQTTFTPRNTEATIRTTTCLIIDEVSMASVDLLNDIEKILKRVRACPKPFGGLQVILCGDFFQLQPVGTTTPCYKHPSFPQRIFVLTKTHRQDDNAFIHFLNSVRSYDTTTVHEYIRTNLTRKLDTTDQVTHVMYKRSLVAQRNAEILADLPGLDYVYRANDHLTVPQGLSPKDRAAHRQGLIKTPAPLSMPASI
ncbi:ATP-dependent DNA helicase PIF7 [Yarrowia lipolytica]|nr:ATP-dependent DNA helicase PIF7 [Yarrowia lipolytica]